MTTQADTRDPEEAGGLRRELRFWEAIAIAFLGYTIYKNIEGTSFPYNHFPFVVGAWLLVGLAITVAFPGLARSIGASLAAREGLRQES